MKTNKPVNVIILALLLVTGCTTIDSRTKSDTGRSHSTYEKKSVQGGGDFMHILSIASLLAIVYGASIAIAKEADDENN